MLLFPCLSCHSCSQTQSLGKCLISQHLLKLISSCPSHTDTSHSSGLSMGNHCWPHSTMPRAATSSAQHYFAPKIKSCSLRRRQSSLKKSNFLIFSHCMNTTPVSSPPQDSGQKGTCPSLTCRGPGEFLLPSHQEHPSPPAHLPYFPNFWKAGAGIQGTGSAHSPASHRPPQAPRLHVQHPADLVSLVQLVTL